MNTETGASFTGTLPYAQQKNNQNYSQDVIAKLVASNELARSKREGASDTRVSAHRRSTMKSSNSVALCVAQLNSATKMKLPPSPTYEKQHTGTKLTKSLLDQHEAYQDIDADDEE